MAFQIENYNRIYVPNYNSRKYSLNSLPNPIYRVGLIPINELEGLDGWFKKLNKRFSQAVRIPFVSKATSKRIMTRIGGVAVGAAAGFAMGGIVGAAAGGVAGGLTTRKGTHGILGFGKVAAYGAAAGGITAFAAGGIAAATGHAGAFAGSSTALGGSFGASGALVGSGVGLGTAMSAAGGAAGLLASGAGYIGTAMSVVGGAGGKLLGLGGKQANVSQTQDTGSTIMESSVSKESETGTSFTTKALEATAKVGEAYLTTPSSSFASLTGGATYPSSSITEPDYTSAESAKQAASKAEDIQDTEEEQQQLLPSADKQAVPNKIEQSTLFTTKNILLIGGLGLLVFSLIYSKGGK